MQSKTEYFAGANTRNGYQSYFAEIIGQKYKKVYILKGSAGSGKSTFMKRIGERANREGMAVEYIRCSADTTSFDGILLPAKGVAVVDGTAPHIMNAKYPSARESIINLGSFWDEEKLALKREELIALTDKKLECYDNSFRALAAAGSIRELRGNLIAKVTLDAKLSGFAERISKKLIKPGKGSVSVRFQTALNDNGYDSLPTFSSAKNVYLIRDRFDIAYKILECINEYAIKIGADRIISFDPLETKKIEAIYFPSTDILFVSEARFVPGETAAESNKPINTVRFINKKEYSEIRQKDRAAVKLYNALIKEACGYFEEAHKLHDSIERIYIRAMDFVKLTDYTNKFIGELFRS